MQVDPTRSSFEPSPSAGPTVRPSPTSSLLANSISQQCPLLALEAASDQQVSLDQAFVVARSGRNVHESHPDLLLSMAVEPNVFRSVNIDEAVALEHFLNAKH